MLALKAHCQMGEAVKILGVRADCKLVVSLLPEVQTYYILATKHCVVLGLKKTKTKKKPKICCQGLNQEFFL